MIQASIYNYSLEDRVFVASSDKATIEILELLSYCNEIPVLESLLKNDNAIFLKDRVSIKLARLKRLKRANNAKVESKKEVEEFIETSYSILYSTVRTKLKYLDSKNSKSELRKKIIENAESKRILNRILKNGTKEELILAIENKIATDSFLINVLCSYKFKEDEDIKFAVIDSNVLLPLSFLKRFYIKENKRIEKNLKLLNSIKNKINQLEI
jgi:hypothetical protein